MSGRHPSTFLFREREVSYERVGAGRTMVFYPNAFTTARLFERQIGYFRSTHDVIGLNPLGIVSDRDDARFPIAVYVDLLEKLVSDLDIRAPILVGNCIGSLACLHYAARRPREVSALVLINMHTKEANAAGAMGPITEMALRLAAAPEVPRSFMRDLEGKDLEDFPYLANQFGDVIDEEYREFCRKVFEDPAVRLSLVSLSYDLDSYVLPEAARLGRLPPVCWIWGEKNRIFPFEVGEATAAMLKPAERHVVRGGGHAVAREQPDEVNRIIDGFLARNLMSKAVTLR